MYSNPYLQIKIHTFIRTEKSRNFTELFFKSINKNQATQEAYLGTK
jgi:hypothetical protein